MSVGQPSPYSGPEIPSLRGGTSRSDISRTLGTPGPYSDTVFETISERATSLIDLMGCGCDNDCTLVKKAGSIRVVQMSGGQLGIRFSLDKSEKPDDQGLIFVDRKTGKADFHSGKTTCNQHLRMNYAGQAGLIVDNFIEQLKRR